MIQDTARAYKEVATGGDGSVNLLSRGFVVVHVAAGREESIYIGRGLLDVALDIHGETRGLGEGEAEVEGNGAWHSAESDEEPPAEVDVVPLVRGEESVEKKEPLISALTHRERGR